jgi:dienelactone hydrolase
VQRSLHNLKQLKNGSVIRPIFLASLIALASTGVNARGYDGYADKDFEVRQIPVPYDVSVAWDNAKVFYPGQSIFSQSFGSSSVNDIPLTSEHPVIIFLHGSGGFGNDDLAWGKFLSKNGYVVIFPMSYSIPGRFRTTPTKKELEQNGYNRSVKKLKVPTVKLRKAEAAFALKEIRKYPWVDLGAVFLMGHSEGGGAAARFGMPGLAGVITSGYKCIGRVPVAVNNDVPMLALNHQTDKWFTREGNPNCTDRAEFNDQVWSKEVVLPGEGHDTHYSDTTKNAVIDFIEGFR